MVEFISNYNISALVYRLHEMFALNILKPDFRVDLRSVGLFHRSQWDRPGATSSWYLVYRLVMFMLVGGGVLLHILSEREQMQARWLLFLSHQSILLLAVHHFIYVVIVAHRRQSTVHQVTLVRLSLVPAKFSSISSYMELM